MIQEQYKSNVQEVSAGTVSTGFNIEINESMFQMLTSKVYNDPTLAVIREWSTNACDACIVAKKEPNYEVHLPTENELYFSVRDYGTGLHPDDVVGLFSTLGSSTKRNSNELNGTFGIGRMAGLAVSSGFSVESYYEGKLYSYAISVQNGVPVTISLGQQETKEPNGLKLSVAVDVDDIYHYYAKAKKLYMYFDHKPSLNVPLTIELDMSEHISDEWFIKADEDRYVTDNCVVMSQIAYTIPVDTKIETYGFINLVIKAPSGAVSFNPGRESLSLTKETIAYINTRMAEIKEEYVDSALMAISNATNDKEVYTTYKSVTNNAPREIRALIKVNPFYSDYLNTMLRENYQTIVSCTHEFNALSNNKISLSHKQSYRKGFTFLSEMAGVRISEFMANPHVVVDLKTKFKSAINIEYSNASVICWSKSEGVEIEDFLEETKKITALLGITYVLASHLVKKHSTNCELGNIAAPPRKGLYASSLNPYNFAFNKSREIPAENAQKHTYLYVKLNNTTPVLKHPTFTMYDFAKVHKLLSHVRIMPEIFGVPKKYQAIADNLDNWVDLEQFILDRTKETKFKIPLDVKLPIFDRERIALSSLPLYPRKLQDYYLEIEDYKTFNTTNNFVNDPLKIELLKNMGALFCSYAPSREVDLDVIENTFPKTLRLLALPYFKVDCPQYFISDLAKLEEEHALRSTSK